MNLARPFKRIIRPTPWNLKHLANAVVIDRMQRLNAELGVFTPLVVTIDELGPPPEGSE